VRLNRRFGGHSTAVKLLKQVASPKDAFTLLDVGAASGDTGRFLKGLFSNARIVSLDCNAVNGEDAPHPKVMADAFTLPFAPQSFDYVFSSLFLHHFADDQVVRLLKGFFRVARKAVLITDLERHILPYWFLPATRAFLKWDPITVHDGPISVRAGFTRRELEQLAASAGMTRVNAEVHRPAFRLSLVGRK
jgi:ubiquinone/menaquinone biosynthesis C-methylase UbiE